MAARSADGRIECFDPTENEHRDHILKVSRVPAAIAPRVSEEARAIAARIAQAFDYVGVLAVELFVMPEGSAAPLLVNEIAPRIAEEARGIAARIAQAFDYVGVLAVELFVMPEGSAAPLLVNEIAPRVHNSGHWTIDGASVSQFEQHIRAVAGWPLATPVRHGRVEMINLIGSEVDDYVKWLETPGARVHLYGKTAVRPGRKMGHVTRIFED